MSEETKKQGTKRAAGTSTGKAKSSAAPRAKAAAKKTAAPKTAKRKAGSVEPKKAGPRRVEGNRLTAKERTKLREELGHFQASAKYVWYSPYKLRPLVNVIRGKDVPYAMQWLSTYRNQRSQPITKVLSSAIANAKSYKNIDPAALVIREIFVEEGPTYRYFKPGAQGRSNEQKKRLCHISVTVATKA
jgi:large subunit ribosomal protein L22